MEGVYEDRGFNQPKRKHDGRHILIAFLVLALILVAVALAFMIFYELTDSSKERTDNLISGKSKIKNVIPSDSIINYTRNNIQIIPISLREYLNHWFISGNMSRTDAKMHWASELMDLNSKTRNLGINIADEINSKYMVGSNGKSYFAAFFDYKRAPTCNRNYLIQKSKLTRKYFYANGSRQMPNTEKYLVEVWKLSEPDKTTIWGDRHTRNYKLIDDFKEEYVAEIEVGCGTIPGKFEGDYWPDNSSVYKLLQDYSEDLGLYPKVKFDFSLSYKMEGSFDAEGAYSFKINALNMSVDYLPVEPKAPEPLLVSEISGTSLNSGL